MTDRDECLRQFFGSYFHQDWDIAGPTWMHVVREFVRDNPREHVVATRDALQSWLDDPTSGRFLPRELACDYAPSGDGLDDRPWLRAVVSFMDSVLG